MVAFYYRPNIKRKKALAAALISKQLTLAVGGKKKTPPQSAVAGEFFTEFTFYVNLV